jgi:chromosome segregation ATPase
MGDSAEFEKLSELEARLATALDRIASGQAALERAAGDAAGAAAGLGAAELARQEAEARAAELSERVALLEAQLSETQDALSETTADLATARSELEDARQPVEAGTDASAMADLEARLTEAEASRNLAQDMLAEREAELADKDAALTQARADAEAAAQAAEGAEGADLATPLVASDGDGPPDIEDMEKALALMTRRVERARVERDEARIACDRAVDIADELREAMGQTPEDRVLDLRGQLRLMKTRAEDLAAQLAIVNSGADAAGVEQGLVSELEALRQLRAADAAELDRIIADVESGPNAAGEGHAHA